MKTPCLSPLVSFDVYSFCAPPLCLTRDIRAIKESQNRYCRAVPKGACPFAHVQSLLEGTDNIGFGMMGMPGPSEIGRPEF